MVLHTQSWSLFFLFGMLASCGSTPVAPKAEHEARLLSPIPACATVLPSPGPGVQVALRDEYWKLVFPSFDEANGNLPPDASTCTGAKVLEDAAFADTTVEPKLTDGEITLGGGADGIKAVWLRSHATSDGQQAGAIALVRLSGEFAYVIAVGSHRGRADARLSMERLGTEVVLLVRDEGCKKREPDMPCESLLTVYLARQGRLLRGTRVMIEQIAYGDGVSFGEVGEVFHLIASPSFVKDELRVVEHVSVRDRFEKVTRWAELERVFIVMGDVLEPSDAPLWSRVVRPKQVSR